MLIGDRQIDPDVANPQEICRRQGGMVVQAMVEPAVELALHGVAIHGVRNVVIDAVIEGTSACWRSQECQVFSEHH
jgi:hypothetical protein